MNVYTRTGVLTHICAY